MKKIVIALNDAWSAYNFRYQLALNLKNNNYEVIFVTPYSEYSEKLKEEFGYQEINIDNRSTNPFKDLYIIYSFYLIYKELKPDIILHYNIKANIYGTIAANILKIPTINNVAGLGTLFEKKSLLTSIAKRLYKFSFKNATKVFFQNNEDYSLFIDEKLVKKNICDILPGSGVDINRFKPIHEKKIDTFKFLLAARLLWSKGVGEYVEAARLIRKDHDNVEFQILGFLDVLNPSAITKKEMDQWSDEGIIKYIGTSDNVDIEIGNANCVVLPSYYREGVPKILLEAASMAKPIITTNNIGCKDVVDDEINGYLCKIKDSYDLANKMNKMLKLADSERILMGNKSREKILECFDEKIVLDRYLNAIKIILNKGN